MPNCLQRKTPSKTKPAANAGDAANVVNDSSSSLRVFGGSATGKDDTEQANTSAVIETHSDIQGLQFIIQEDNSVRPPAPVTHRTASNAPTTDLIEDLTLEEFLAKADEGKGDDNEVDYDHILSSSQSSDSSTEDD